MCIGQLSKEKAAVHLNNAFGCVSQTQTDLLDLNKQNRDGLTPLMLAVRDVDLFEGMQLPWKYQPVEVVKELMSLLV